jgi:hypothetical protein
LNQKILKTTYFLLALALDEDMFVFDFIVLDDMLVAWLAFAIVFAAAFAIEFACVCMLFAAEFIAFAAEFIAFATALFAFALAVFDSPPQAIPRAVKAKRPESAISFFIIEQSPVFLKD